MTRQYWSGHKKEEGLNVTNSHIAGLIIANFNQPEIPIEKYPPYVRYLDWLGGEEAYRSMMIDEVWYDR